MADLRAELPPHCQVKKRKGYEDVYFMIHPKDRPKDWKPDCTPLGRTDKVPVEEIIKKAKAEYDRYQAFLLGNDTNEPEFGTFPAVIRAYKESNFWKKLAPKTKKEYDRYCGYVEEWSGRARGGHPQIEILTVPIWIKWLNTFNETPTQRSRIKSLVSNLYKIAYNEGLNVEKDMVKNIELEPLEDVEKRPLVLWEQKHVDMAVSEADRRGYYSIGGILLTAIETAQRRSDVTSMIYGKDYKDGQLRYYQDKTKKHVWLNATDKLRERLDKYHTKNLSMFTNENTGKPWHPDSVTHLVREILNDIGLHNHILMQMRHSQVNYLFDIGCDEKMVTAMTGHESPKTLRKHYKEKINQKLANQAVEMINQHRKTAESDKL